MSDQKTDNLLAGDRQMPSKRNRGPSINLDTSSGSVRCRVILQVYDPRRQNYKGQGSARFSLPKTDTARVWACVVSAIEHARPGSNDLVDRGLDGAATSE